MKEDAMCADDVSDHTIRVVNPATGSLVGEVPAGGKAAVAAAVDRAEAAQADWAKRDPRERGKVLGVGARAIRAQTDTLAALLTAEQGKPLHEARNEIQGCANVLEYYHSVSGSLRGECLPLSSYGLACVLKEPVGVCGAIIPWNMPVLIFAWKIGPALVAGNAIVVKPASSTPLTTLRIADILETAGLPAGVLQVVTGTGDTAGVALAATPALGHLSFTGDTKTGAGVSRAAGRNGVPVTLELGGSDAMIVCRDADIPAAAAGAVSGRFYNCGQTCTAVKRVVVDTSIKEAFIRALCEKVGGIVVGDGSRNGVGMGPMNNAAARDTICRMMDDGVSCGEGTLLCGGGIPDGEEYKNGLFYEPTIVADLPNDSALLNTEVFGPVLPVIAADGLDAAIEIANSIRYGLGASVWTRDIKTAMTASSQLDAGIVWVNQHLRIPPDVPFGGMKASGIGRENGSGAFEPYLRSKTVLVKP
ncbi:aldehyde dehydrogenase family protein [Methanogenium organophilum]|uniref:Aldehyde dehydrogenase family protein n=1 Tax=Methanogenium organophilum TaxID=2199 RepID=A0A9X9S2Y5_METOG|nr:aldehyde dehydrogenase family protein [Methanogenium organophilum]WAI00919.1 aldehyde dehydrogenase family protein [Methanogenium organophilum]